MGFLLTLHLVIYYIFNYVDGKRQGEYIGYYESGEVKWKGNYVDDFQQGETIYYNIYGEIDKIENYKDGVLIEE